MLARDFIEQFELVSTCVTPLEVALPRSNLVREKPKNSNVSRSAPARALRLRGMAFRSQTEERGCIW